MRPAGYAVPKGSPLEEIMDGYIDQCQSMQMPGSPYQKAQNQPWSRFLRNYNFTEATSKALIQRQQTKVPQRQPSDPITAFIADYAPEGDAPYDRVSLNRSDFVKTSHKGIIDALLTVHNYCPTSDTSRSCGKIQVSFLNHIARLYDAEKLSAIALSSQSNFLGSIGRSDNPQDDAELKGKSYTDYFKYKSLPEAVRPPKFAVIDKFIDEVIALKPSVGNRVNFRKYCGERGKLAGNPFIHYEGCEYLSALYYRDFVRVVELDKLWIMPPLMVQDSRVSEYGPELKAIFAVQNNFMLRNPERFSIAQPLTMSYLVDYDAYQGSCLADDSVNVAYSDNKSMSFKALYGHTLLNGKKYTETHYNVAKKWHKPLLFLSDNIKGDASALLTFFDRFYAETKEAKRMEYQLSSKRLQMRTVMNDLNHFVRKQSCGSPALKTLDTKLHEFNLFRTALNDIPTR